MKAQPMPDGLAEDIDNVSTERTLSYLKVRIRNTELTGMLC